MLLLPYFVQAQRVYSKMEQDVAVISYTVQTGSSLAEIAEKFHVNVDDLAKLNQQVSQASLVPGTTLNIPVMPILKPSCDVDCFEVYYEVKAREGLYRIGKNFGYQNATTIKQLNSLRSESLGIGQLLLVGYISKSAFTTMVVNQDSMLPINATVTPGNKPAEPVFIAIKKAEPAPAVNDSSSSIDMRYQGEGFFKTDYEPGVGNSLLHASIFKTEAGWTDGKFYVLTDQAPAGKVVKIQHPITGAVVYAKVLGELPKLPKKDQVQIRLCSAAAATLGVSENEMFDVQLLY